jgi:hypothetical protein
MFEALTGNMMKITREGKKRVRDDSREKKQTNSDDRNSARMLVGAAYQADRCLSIYRCLVGDDDDANDNV